MELYAGAGGGLRGAEVDPDSTEAFEKLEGCVFIVDPKQGLKPLLHRLKTGNRIIDIFHPAMTGETISQSEYWLIVYLQG